MDNQTNTEQNLHILPDFIKDDLDMIVVGLNPSLTSAQIGHYFAGPGNHFWSCMSEVGLVPEPVTCYDDSRMIDYGIGFINACSRPTKGAADLSKKELKDGMKLLLSKLQRYNPKIVVFNGKGTYEIFIRHKHFGMGKQPNRLEGTNSVIFVMPSSSARCAQLPRAADKIPFFSALKELRDRLRSLSTSGSLSSGGRLVPIEETNGLVIPDQVDLELTRLYDAGKSNYSSDKSDKKRKNNAANSTVNSNNCLTNGSSAIRGSSDDGSRSSSSGISLTNQNFDKSRSSSSTTSNHLKDENLNSPSHYLIPGSINSSFNSNLGPPPWFYSHYNHHHHQQQQQQHYHHPQQQQQQQYPIHPYGHLLPPHQSLPVHTGSGGHHTHILSQGPPPGAVTVTVPSQLPPPPPSLSQQQQISQGQLATSSQPQHLISIPTATTATIAPSPHHHPHHPHHPHPHPHFDPSMYGFPPRYPINHPIFRPQLMSPMPIGFHHHHQQQQQQQQQHHHQQNGVDTSTSTATSLSAMKTLQNGNVNSNSNVNSINFPISLSNNCQSSSSSSSSSIDMSAPSTIISTDSTIKSNEKEEGAKEYSTSSCASANSNNNGHRNTVASSTNFISLLMSDSISPAQSPITDAGSKCINDNSNNVLLSTSNATSSINITIGSNSSSSSNSIINSTSTSSNTIPSVWTDNNIIQSSNTNAIYPTTTAAAALFGSYPRRFLPHDNSLFPQGSLLTNVHPHSHQHSNYEAAPPPQQQQQEQQPQHGTSAVSTMQNDNGYSLSAYFSAVTTHHQLFVNPSIQNPLSSDQVTSSLCSVKVAPDSTSIANRKRSLLDSLIPNTDNATIPNKQMALETIQISECSIFQILIFLQNVFINKFE